MDTQEPSMRNVGRQKQYVPMVPAGTIGVAVILTNDYVSCPDPKWRQLPGTKEDHQTWKSALGSLLFDVQSYTNLTRTETIHLLQNVSALEISVTSSAVKQHLVLVYCGHGEKDYIVCQDGQRLKTDDVCEPFLQHRYGTAVPKLLFFDTCRGAGGTGQAWVGYTYTSSYELSPRAAKRVGTSTSYELMPSEGNYLVVFSTLPGYIAQVLSSYSGSTSHGMWSQMFAPKLAASNMPITALLKEVNREMMHQCQALLSQSALLKDTTFQVAEISKCTLIEDVNLFASAAQLYQPLSQMVVRAPQVPSKVPSQHQPSPPPSWGNYRSRFNNDFKQRYQLNVVETPTSVENGYIFRLQVEWEGKWYSVQSQPCRTKKEAKEEACRLMVETLEGLISHGSHPPAPPKGHIAAPPTSLCMSPAVAHGLTTPTSHLPAVHVSRGTNKKYQELLNECRQKVENAGGRWSLTGEHENVAQNTFQCQLTLDVTPSEGAAPLHFVSELVQVVGRMSESKEKAAEDLVHQLQRSGIVRLT